MPAKFNYFEGPLFEFSDGEWWAVSYSHRSVWNRMYEQTDWAINQSYQVYEICRIAEPIKSLNFLLNYTIIVPLSSLHVVDIDFSSSADVLGDIAAIGQEKEQSLSNLEKTITKKQNHSSILSEIAGIQKTKEQGQQDVSRSVLLI